VELAGHRATRRVSHYAELPTGEPGFLSGSRGTVEVSLRGESLADRWRVGRGTPVRVVIRGR
jgi:S-adenosylmethionine hydrolase